MIELYGVSEIVFGRYSFLRLPSLTLRDFPALTVLRGEEHCLSAMTQITLEQLPQLTSILAGYYAMSHVDTLELTSMK